MKRLTVLLAALLIVGWGSPSLADEYPDDLAGKWFYVMLLHDVDGRMIDYGWFYFWEDEDGYKKLDQYWEGGGGTHTADRELDEAEGCGDFGRYGSIWDAWQIGTGQVCPYFEFDWFYCKRWETLIGHAYLADDSDGQRKYTLNGWYWPYNPFWQ